RRRVHALELLDVAPVEDELVATRRLRLEHAGQEVVLTRAPLGRAPRTPRAEAGEERRGRGLLPVEADAEIGIERLEERNRLVLVALLEALGEAFERRRARVPIADPVQELRAAQDLVHDLLTDSRFAARLRQVDLEEPAELHLGRERVEGRGDAAVSLGRLP